MLPARGDSFEGKTVCISGAGNVAIYACEKAQQLGAKVVTMSDSTGYVYDKNGINLDVVKQIKRSSAAAFRVRRAVARSRVPRGPRRVGHPLRHRAAVRHAERAASSTTRTLVKNGVHVVAEGANMPTTEATSRSWDAGVPSSPARPPTPAASPPPALR
jgi:glutamate dehydrogenase (NADP+)